MSGIWGKSIRLSIFGESHGKAVGLSIDGLKPGILLDVDNIRKEMRRRAPGKNELSTPRQEEDDFEILSGFFQGRTTGTPLCTVIYNTDKRSGDYEELKSVMRPSHADYSGFMKYDGYNDYRGGGHFSGRLTAPLVFAGAVCKQLLTNRGVVLGSHICRIGEEQEELFDLVNIDADILKKLAEEPFPVLDCSKRASMKACITAAAAERDSVGGVVETAVLGLKPGIGEPFFDSVESILSHLIFSIPGVKGLEFGAGFKASEMRGSKANDSFYTEGQEVKTRSNNSGGIQGGITNGMPVVFRTAFKPTASIGQLQHTVDVASRENVELEIKGRHDPCIVPRALPAVEAVAAIGLLDLILQGEGI